MMLTHLAPQDSAPRHLLVEISSSSFIFFFSGDLQDVPIHFPAFFTGTEHPLEAIEAFIHRAVPEGDAHSYTECMALASCSAGPCWVGTSRWWLLP